ncbi:MAG: YMGG-like glycine zipper-containing protein [Rhodovibrionaceae bacterium]
MYSLSRVVHANNLYSIGLAAFCLALLMLVSGCGNSTGDRAVSGAGIGAGVGAVGGLMVGAPLQGALIGGAVGAGTGALTDESQINLGWPIWK